MIAGEGARGTSVMKKSGKVTLGFVAGAAMVLLSCQRTEMQRCVDQYGMVTEDFYCDPARPSTYRNFYHWHYGGSGGFGYGTYVHGGSSIALPNLDGNYPVIGSWMIDQEAGGMGIRESDGPITTNLSRFVPHMFE